MPRKVFTAGEVLAAADVNTYLMDQAVMTFAGTAARASAISTATASEGMVTYLADTDTFEFWDGSAYQPFGVADPVEFDFLILAGGGGGGCGESPSVGDTGAGGGAGGYRSSVTNTGGSAAAESPMTLPAGSYTLKVGAGGAAGVLPNQGGDGGNSFFGTITAIGGGGGGSGESNGVGRSGGSGGGQANGGAGTGFRTSGLTGQGSLGGGANTNRVLNGGGGGAGAAATTQNGGAGLTNSITGSSVTRGGGGGGNAGGTGGSGGGGNAATTTTANNAQSGTVNTGGGGGGGPYGNLGNGGAGGSGIVILKYPDTVTLTIGAGLTSSTITSGSFKITQFTAGEDEVSF